MREFTTKQIEAATGLKQNTLHYYIEAGGIIPADPGDGRGTRRVLNWKNFIEAAILKRLLDLGLMKQRNLSVLKMLRDHEAWEKVSLDKLLDLKPYYIFLLLNNKGLSVDILVQDPRPEPISFSQISDDEFFQGLKDPQYPILRMTMDHRFDLVTMIDVVAIVLKYRSYLL